MAQISRDQRKTLGKFLDIAFRRNYLIDWDMWDLQIDFAPETGYWSVPFADVEDSFPKFEEYRNGVAAGIRLGLETAVRANVKDGGLNVAEIRQYAAPLLEGFRPEVLKWPASHGMGNMLIHTDVFQILDGLPQNMQSSGIFDDYLESSDNSLREYARNVSDLLAKHVRDAANDDKHVIGGLTEIASYAYAYWKAEDWRFRKSERGDEISDDALDVFTDALDELDRMSAKDCAGPDTVEDAILAFMEAYSVGKPPIKPLEGGTDVQSR